ncbi:MULTISPECIES: nucleotidyltransferase family protein [unclassified Microbacterium]|uniref:nucleotidyltransferase family protein n=1 Tax=unclassified Microbacterium TaxID=2609290 RepID=UPI001AC1D1D9|nr:nucleotidyltransferase family protein [Microbacterium sp.]MBN9157259.1 nucleotidyltransferase family protein [Microbacterium sp.]MBS1896442.1 nucleotidyltransferase family protein [Actinomycetota bacterium]
MGVPEVPIWALTHLTHASLQRTAEQRSIDLLHIKGPATRLSLRDGWHDSSDADVLVRPAHQDRFLKALVEDGWTLFSGFDENAPFEYAANFTHPSWTYADVHRQLSGPRATPEAVFERLWRDHETADIGHHPCPVPSVSGQILVQTLHIARSHDPERAEAWALSTPELRDAALVLAHELDADEAFVAGIGDLDAPSSGASSRWDSMPQDPRHGRGGS